MKKAATVNPHQLWGHASSEEGSPVGVELFRKSLREGGVSVNIENVCYSINNKNYISSGGSKKIYDLGDGNVIAVPQVDYEMWKRMAKEEETASTEFIKLGLLASEQQQSIASVNNEKFIVLRMPKFKDMAKQGIQVRGQASKDKYGQTMLFGSRENLLNKNYWHSLFQYLKQDIIIILVNGIFVDRDSKHIAIANTKNTPEHNIDEPDLITNRNQQLRAFFFDFSHKTGELKLRQCYYFVDFEGNGSVLKHRISEEVDRTTEKYVSCALEGITEHEYSLLADRFIIGFWQMRPQGKVYEEFLSEFKDNIVEAVINGISKLNTEQQKERFSNNHFSAVSTNNESCKLQ